LDGRPFTVAGAMAAGFQFPVQRDPVGFWTTMAMDAKSMNGAPPITSQRGIAYLDVIARLKPQATLLAARSEMATIQDSVNRQHPENRPKGISLIPEDDAVVGAMRQRLYILLAAVG